MKQLAAVSCWRQASTIISLVPFFCARRALRRVRAGPEAVFDEVEQGRLIGHARQARIGPHEMQLAARILRLRLRLRLAPIALARGLDRRIHDYVPIDRAGYGVIRGLGYLDAGNTQMISGAPARTKRRVRRKPTRRPLRRRADRAGFRPTRRGRFDRCTRYGCGGRRKANDRAMPVGNTRAARRE